MGVISGLSDGPGLTVQMHSSPRSPLSGIPVRSAPAAAVSPVQVSSERRFLLRCTEIDLQDAILFHTLT